MSLFWTLRLNLRHGCHFFGHSYQFWCASVTFLDIRTNFGVRVSLFWTFVLNMVHECHFFGHSYQFLPANGYYPDIHIYSFSIIQQKRPLSGAFTSISYTFDRNIHVRLQVILVQLLYP